MSLQTRLTTLINTIANDVKALISGKQPNLVAGTNIKNINGSSPLGSGNLVVYGSRTFVFGGTGTPVVGNDLTPRVMTNFKGQFTRINAHAKTPPSGGSFTINIEQSATNNFSSGVTSVATISITTGTLSNGADIAVNVNENVFLRLNITAVNGAADWTVELREIQTP